jgi:hypothetical protein
VRCRPKSDANAARGGIALEYMTIADEACFSQREVPSIDIDLYPKYEADPRIVSRRQHLTIVSRLITVPACV